MGRSFVLVSPPRPRERLEAIVRRILTITIIVLVVAALGGLAFELFVSPNMLVRRIELSSDVPLTREQVVSLAGLEGTTYYFAVDGRAVESRLKAYPLVREAFVQKVFPETLKVTLVRRRPLALAYASVNGKTMPAVFDDEGVLFERGADVAERDLPVLSGVRLEDLKPGTALPKIMQPFLRDLGELKRTNATLFDLISEIQVIGSNSGSYELVLYPLVYKVRVWMGKRLNPGMLRYMFFTLYFMEQRGLLGEVDEVDFRSGDAVYHRKGEK
ncbi:MAG: FtsQ-type POTRA domain-containing protein [Spirochaetales bacterium]|nr:FtsQ-type POTRA domain-containing protein [Spirochaetales bacterium]